jgi:hypothetical protein
MIIRCGATLYRQASVKDLARLVAQYLFKWLAEAQISKQTILAWLKGLYESVSAGPGRARESGSSLVPSYLVKHIAKVFSELSAQGATFGDFVAELSSALDNPPKGYEWVIREGKEYLVSTEPRNRATMPVRGKRFLGHVLVGVWWTTPDAKSKRNVQLRRFLEKNSGGVFYKRTDRMTKLREYGGFLVAPHISVEGLGIELLALAAAAAEGGGQFHLSAVRLDKLSQTDPHTGRTLQLDTTDQFFTHSVKSVVFRPVEPRSTLPSIVNGEVTEYRGLLQMLRQAL